MSDVTYKKHGLAISDRWEIVWKLTNLVMAVFFLLAAFVNVSLIDIIIISINSSSCVLLLDLLLVS